MTTDFQLSILATPQRRLWDELEAVPGEFVLYGGTALALHLGHRQSVDYAFFGNRLFDPARLAARISFLTGATITQQEPLILGCDLHLSFENFEAAIANPKRYAIGSTRYVLHFRCSL